MGEYTVGRNENIDILRGVAMLLTVWGHAIQYMASGHLNFFDNEAFRFIYSFHMPLFMILSGYTYGFSFEKHAVRTLIAKRVTQIVYPCVLWCSVSHLFGRGIDLAQGEITLLSLLKGWLPALTGYWFLWAVAVCSLMLLLYKVLTGWTFALSQLLLLFGVRYLPNGSMLLYMYPYFLCGFFINRRNGRQSSISFRSMAAVLALAYPVLLLHFRTEHYIYETGVWLIDVKKGISQIGIDLFRWLIGFSGIAFIIVAAEALSRCLGNILKRIRRIFAGMGKISLEIYLVQGFLFGELIPRLLYHVPVNLVKLCGGEILYTYLFCPIAAAVIIGAVTIFVRMIHKNKCVSRILMGR